MGNSQTRSEGKNEYGGSLRHEVAIPSKQFLRIQKIKNICMRVQCFFALCTCVLPLSTLNDWPARINYMLAYADQLFYLLYK